MRLLRWTVGAAVFLALLFLSLQNADPVTLRVFNFVTWQAPLVFVVLIAFTSGVALGLLSAAFRMARLKRQLNRLRRDHREPAPVPAPHGVAPGTAPASGPGFETPGNGY